MTTIQTIALAGATGNMGTPVLEELLAAGFTVTVLERQTSTHTYPPSAKVTKVDYSDPSNVSAAIKGHDALISTLGHVAQEQQSILVDAAIAVGIKRFIPSEFGSDTTLPKLSTSPMYKDKIEATKEVERKCEGTQTTYTIIQNNVFLDWALDYKFGINLKEKKMEMYDGGETVYTTTPLRFVAKGVVAVLRNPEKTANRIVRLHGTSMTQKKLLEIAQRVVGKDGWQITEANTADLEKQSYENLKNDPSNVLGWIIGFLTRNIFAEGYGGNFEQNNDNEMLGLKEMSEKEVEDVVRSKA